jgi:hypothetical protein
MIQHPMSIYSSQDKSHKLWAYMFIALCGYLSFIYNKSKRVIKNPRVELGDGEEITVYRIQNKSGVGPYRGTDSPYDRAYNASIKQMLSMTQMMNEKNFLDDHAFWIDVLTRLDVAGEKRRIPPEKDEGMNHQDKTFFRKQKPYTGFISIEQMMSWFPFPQELQWLSDQGYNLYRFKTNKVHATDVQCYFVPSDKGELVTEFTPEEVADIKRFSNLNYKKFILDGYQAAKKEGLI